MALAVRLGYHADKKEWQRFMRETLPPTKDDRPPAQAAADLMDRFKVAPKPGHVPRRK